MKKVYFLIIAGLLFGCSSQNATKPGGLSLIKTSGEKGDWVTSENTYWEEDGSMYFKVELNNETDLEYADAGLDGAASTVLISKVKTRALRELHTAMPGAGNSIGKARENVLDAIAQATFSDLVKEKKYWEQFEKNDGLNSVSYIYHIYALYSIPELEFQKAKVEAWKKAEEISEADQEAKQLLRDPERRKRFLDAGK